MQLSIFHPMIHLDESTLDVAALYDQTLQLVIEAEQLGYHAFFFNEGRIREANYRLPSTALMVAAASRLTSKILLGSGVVLLTGYNPKMVAEDALALDALTRGRYLLGVGLGFRTQEFLQLGIPPQLKYELFDMKLAALCAMLEGKNVNAQTPFYNAAGSEPSLPVVPHMRHRMLRGCTSERGAHATGKAGLQLMLSPNDVIDRPSTDHYRNCVDAYHAGWQESCLAHLPPPPHLTLVFAHVADTDAQAEANITPYIENFKRIVGGLDALPNGKSYYEYYRNDPFSLVGAPDTIRKRLRHMKNLGAQNVLLLHNIGGLPHTQVQSSMRRFAREIMPDFQKAAINEAAPLEGVA